MDPRVSYHEGDDGITTIIENLYTLCDKLNIVPDIFLQKVAKSLSSKLDENWHLDGLFTKEDIMYAMRKNNMV